MRKQESADVLEPVRPVVPTDTERAAELERRRQEALKFRPTNGFLYQRGQSR